MQEAEFYNQLDGELVQCALCPHTCNIYNQERGKCGVRQNKNGKLYSLVYNRLISQAVDPIEKKPLFHFMPSSNTFSIATVGCNFFCKFCQNCTLSQGVKGGNSSFGEIVSPEHIVQSALDNNCKIIAYTYAEPTIAFEYYFDIAKLAHEKGLKNVWVTNGYINPEPLKKISPYLNAVNIDLKSFKEETYKKVMGGKLAPVLESIKLYKSLGIWVEITTLVIPEINDSEEELKDIANFIASVGKEIPWHLSRFHPQFMMKDKPSTSLDTLKKAAEIGEFAGLRYVYIGNIDAGKDSTRCPNCGFEVIQRTGFQSNSYLKEGKCPKCQTELDGEFDF